MAIAVSGTFSSGDLHPTPATATITKPTSPAPDGNSILVVSFGTGGNTSSNTVTPPAGWTSIFTKVTVTRAGIAIIDVQAFWALGNVAALGFANSQTASDQGWVCVAYTGCDLTTPIDATGTGSTSITNTSTITANAVTVATDQAWHVISLASWIGGTWSATSFTAKQNAHVNEDATLIYNTTPKSTGSTGTVSCTTTGSSTNQVMCAAPFALRPAASATKAPPPFHRSQRFFRRMSGLLVPATGIMLGKV